MGGNRLNGRIVCRLPCHKDFLAKSSDCYIFRFSDADVSLGLVPPPYVKFAMPGVSPRIPFYPPGLNWTASMEIVSPPSCQLAVVVM